MNVIRIDRQKHESFLADQRYDPITKELIQAGDEVIVCKKCETVHLKDVWIHTLIGVHCNQKETLANLPKANKYKRFDLINTLNEINEIITNIDFKLFGLNSNIQFNQIFCSKNQIVFDFQIEQKSITKVDVNFKYVYLKQCELIEQSTAIQTVLFKSYFNAEGILLNSKRNTEIGVNLFSRNLKDRNFQLAKRFHHLLIELINHSQNTKN